MQRNKVSITTPMLAVTTVLLIAANLLLGFILMRQSKLAMQSLIRARMLDVSNTAAAMLDGDQLAKLTKDDVQSQDYQHSLWVLRSFQDNIELEYIYAMKQDGDKFIFTIDPSDDPGEFGEEIVSTEALQHAASGVADVDDVPYEDRWGRFYSAYSPVFDSDGNIAGIVGVDFSASWYEARITKTLKTVLFICAMSTAVGILLAFTVTARIRRRFTELYQEMNSLAYDFQDLNKLIQKGSDGQNITTAEEKTEDLYEDSTDEITVLGNQIRSFRTELRQYLTFVYGQAYTDTMTGVGSKTAYLNKVRSIDKQISNGTAAFAVAVFDINGLKRVNDNYGHEVGDKFIIGAATAIKGVFGASNVYRIGGDEFIAVLDGGTSQSVEELFSTLDEVTGGLNLSKVYPIDLTISRGAEIYVKDMDDDYRQVFKRADEAMYRNKCEYYESLKEDNS